MKRKGITPIIAIALMLGLTVGAVVLIQGQIQGLINPDEDRTKGLQNIQGTDMKLNPTYKSSNNVITLNVVNTGDRAINVSDFSIYYGPGDYDNPVPYNVIENSWKVDTNGDGSTDEADNQCFKVGQTPGNGVINPGDSFNCDTGIKFPNALQEVKISVEADGFDKSWETSCVPQTSTSKSC